MPDIAIRDCVPAQLPMLIVKPLDFAAVGIARHGRGVLNSMYPYATKSIPPQHEIPALTDDGSSSCSSAAASAPAC
jgi:hypothetical protein